MPYAVPVEIHLFLNDGHSQELYDMLFRDSLRMEIVETALCSVLTDESFGSPRLHCYSMNEAPDAHADSGVHDGSRTPAADTVRG